MPEESSANRASGSSPTREMTAWTAVVRARRPGGVVLQALGHLVGDGAAVPLGDVLRQPSDPQALAGG